MKSSLFDGVPSSRSRAPKPMLNDATTLNSYASDSLAPTCVTQ